LLLRAIEYGAVVFERTRPFSRLDPAARARALAAWDTSRLGPRRQLLASLKLLALMQFYERPEVWPAVGYDDAHLRQKLLGRPTIPIPLGRCVGGTTTINSGTCYRAPDYVLDEWAERCGVRGAREPDLRPYFERVEQELHVRPVPDETYGRNSTLFERGAA